MGGGREGGEERGEGGGDPMQPAGVGPVTIIIPSWKFSMDSYIPEINFMR